MLENLLAKVFGTRHAREIKRMQPMVAAINDLEPGIQRLSGNRFIITARAVALDFSVEHPVEVFHAFV